MSRELTRQRFPEFAAEVESSPKRSRWLVLTHDNPDPDALASAALLALILRRRFRRHVTIAYGGMIGRAENREMVHSLRFELSHLRNLNLKKFQRVALVDCQPWTGNAALPKAVVPSLVFDHHPMRKTTSAARFVDVRPDYGATATILAEYVDEEGLVPTRALATAVIYAIRSETREFGREATGPDHEIHDWLLERMDKRLLSKIRNARLPVAYFRNLRRALDGMTHSGSLVVSNLGLVDQTDIVPEIADLLLRLEGKTWSLATGEHGDRVYLSIRTTNSRADAGRLIRRLIGRRGKGGGHGTMAGGWVSIPKNGGGVDGREVEWQLAQSFAVALKRNPESLVSIDEGEFVAEPSGGTSAAASA